MTNNKILIRNIYHMLSYAFQELKRNNYKDIEEEEFEQVFDLFAEILYRGVSMQLKQGLYRTYLERNESFSTLRGRLNINGTIRNRIQHRPVLSCEYDELSVNNLFNRILKSTIVLLVQSRELQAKRKKQLRSILPFFNDIDDEDLGRVMWNSLQFQRNNRSYRMLMNICYFITEGMLMTTESGNIRMPMFSEERMCRLFERFVLNYYKQHFPDLSANADSIEWNLDDKVENGKEFLPSMQSDITLHSSDKTLVVDTKYYGEIMQTHFDKKSIRSGHMYQIYTYVKNLDRDRSGKVSGMLLYAHTEEEIEPDLDVVIDGNRFLVKTLDLNQKFDTIQAQLNEFVKIIN